ncbi:MAG: type 4a pilus biogenesis protein PilO [Syntrophaceae bacterium]|nr:type 4a pilus biogenesis protein PilO [Syntrophaceae bacterium]
MAITAEDLKKLSPRMKAVLICLACLLIAYFYYMFYLQSALARKGDLESKLSGLKQEIAAKQKVASQKTKYIQDLKKLNETFQLALTKLPDKKEIPGLFESISLAGRNSGIEFLLFEPMIASPVQEADHTDKKRKQKSAAKAKNDESAADDEIFYTDIPIKVKIVGTFQNTVEFFDKISKLPRIINVENLTLGENKAGKSKEDTLVTSCVIKTYMFLDKEKVKEKGSNDVH